ncbi:MAG: hypothetical protein EOP48_31240 [Sphingobacteriales bacterium]|nr:MAG: hypothetical protein EOP48_31240 [Sphingobacteriales bacterium]
MSEKDEYIIWKGSQFRITTKISMTKNGVSMIWAQGSNVAYPSQKFEEDMAEATYKEAKRQATLKNVGI